MQKSIWAIAGLVCLSFSCSFSVFASCSSKLEARASDAQLIQDGLADARDKTFEFSSSIISSAYDFFVMIGDNDTGVGGAAAMYMMTTSFAPTLAVAAVPAVAGTVLLAMEGGREMSISSTSAFQEYTSVSQLLNEASLGFAGPAVNDFMYNNRSIIPIEYSSDDIVTKLNKLDKDELICNEFNYLGKTVLKVDSLKTIAGKIVKSSESINHVRPSL